MKCKYCGAEIPAGAESCPDCGRVPEIPEKKQEKNPWKLTALIAIGVLVLALVVGLSFAFSKRETEKMDTVQTSADTTVPEATIPADGNPNDVTCKGTYTASDTQIVDLKDNVVATFGDAQLKNSELQIYYWMQYYNFVENYGSIASFLGIDVRAPLDSQRNDSEDMTWQQFFLKNALDNWHLYTALSDKAEAENFTISEELQDYLDHLADVMASTAASNNFASAEEMIRYDMGEGTGYDDYLNYVYAYYISSEYFAEVYKTFQPTDAEVEAYFAQHEADYAEKGLTRDTILVDVRHVLYCPDETKVDESGKFTEEAWEECRVKAQSALDALIAAGMTEEAFAALASAETEDPGSKETGGLYTDVPVGKMVAPFNDWCFDPVRVVGDYGLVKTDYGYHLMYFVGSHTAWQNTAREDLISQMSRDYLDALREETPVKIDYDSIFLALPKE